ncbi:protein CysJ [Bacillus salipaludis]|uniref:diflavin oxidoreductase n=1 Tax=Bacillus salipaludis TaxID=2547811 RepID=UPI002E24564D|nr:protein CysJ [Bacillus salipaludis]
MVNNVKSHEIIKKEEKVVPLTYSRTNPFQAKVLTNINLNGPGSNKETRHIELSLKGSGLSYVPGDCLGIFPKNDQELVEAILAEMKWDSHEEIVINNKGDRLPLFEALTTHFEITLLTKKIMEKAAELTENREILKLVSSGQEDQLKAYIEGRDLLDLLLDFGPWNGSVQDIVSILRKMPPRLYSIASSIAAKPDEVHLTIGVVRYKAHGRTRKGVCSVQCSELMQGDNIPVFIQPNKHFFLPEESDSKIIMVGPGTGIAPFRSFIQERAFYGSYGNSWLFFGDQHYSSDFLYKDELEWYQKEGIITKLNTAFSRDTEEKVYVQHKMLENSKELFAWLEDGAYFYVCGDKQYMAKDVHNTLIDIIEKEGKMDRELAEQYLNEMQKQKRYQRDVY